MKTPYYLETPRTPHMASEPKVASPSYKKPFDDFFEKAGVPLTDSIHPADTSTAAINGLAKILGLGFWKRQVTVPADEFYIALSNLAPPHLRDIATTLSGQIPVGMSYVGEFATSSLYIKRSSQKEYLVSRKPI